MAWAVSATGWNERNVLNRRTDGQHESRHHSTVGDSSGAESSGQCGTGGGVDMRQGATTGAPDAGTMMAALQLAVLAGCDGCSCGCSSGSCHAIRGRVCSKDRQQAARDAQCYRMVAAVEQEQGERAVLKQVVPAQPGSRHPGGSVAASLRMREPGGTSKVRRGKGGSRSNNQPNLAAVQPMLEPPKACMAPHTSAPTSASPCVTHPP